MYYDDDLTVAQDADLKKVTIQIKEQMDELMEHIEKAERNNRTVSFSQCLLMNVVLIVILIQSVGFLLNFYEFFAVEFEKNEDICMRCEPILCRSFKFVMYGHLETRMFAGKLGNILVYMHN